jgi:EEF1A N-terminal glycine/lysine methyltransferase
LDFVLIVYQGKPLYTSSLFVDSPNLRMILPGLIRIERVVHGELEPEDIFGSSLSALFQNDIQLQHGDSTSQIVYASRFGDLKFYCADVSKAEDRKKFAHYLWNSGILLGELVAGKPAKDESLDLFWNKRQFDKDRSWWLDPDEEITWKATGHTVLELGAGWDIQ